MTENADGTRIEVKRPEILSEWSPGVAAGPQGRDDAKDNVFAQRIVRY